MKKVYYLSTCSSCLKIIKSLALKDNFELQDIKTNKISREQLENMAKRAGGAMELFNKRSRKYPLLKKNVEEMDEHEIIELILKEYTFLKRPVIIFEQDIFVGSSKPVIEKLSRKLHQ